MELAVRHLRASGFYLYWLGLTLLLLMPRPWLEAGNSPELTRLIHTLWPYAHVVSFSVLGLLVCCCAGSKRGWLLAGLLAYSALTEIAQETWIAGRRGEWTDLLQDALGLALGTAVWWLLRRFWRPSCEAALSA